MAEKMDWVGAWFPIMEEMGEDTKIPFGRFDATLGTVEWHRLPHQKYDGAGGLAKLLTERGWKLGPIPTREEKPLGFLLKVLAFFKYLNLTRPRTTPWKKYDSQARGPTAGIAWKVLSKVQTQVLERIARKHSCSLNSYLLWSLDRHTRVLFSDATAKAMWWIPVNMRGLIKRPDPWANHSSYCGISLFPKDTPTVAHEKVRQSFVNGSHWGAWWGVNIGRVIGVEGMRKIMKGYEIKQNRWTGTVTNMGAWPPEGSRAGAADNGQPWLVSALVSTSHPIGVGLLTWNGQLTITLQMHPTLTRDFQETKKFFDSWIKELGIQDEGKMRTSDNSEAGLSV